jgi:methionine sulfoxide reductase heme-binding subunit
MGAKRLITHAVLYVACLLSIYLTTLYVPYADLNYVFTLAFGYLSLVLIVLTLSIGTILLLRNRRNPFNLNIRRDIGIWVGITGISHVIFAFTLRFNGEIPLYFIDPETLEIRGDRFGISNILGALATIILTLLLVTSNDYSLKKLKGKRWKTLQRLNYLLAFLVILHTLLYQQMSRRESFFTSITVLLILALLLLQGLGMWLYRAKEDCRLRRSNV